MSPFVIVSCCESYGVAVSECRRKCEWSTVLVAYVFLVEVVGMVVVVGRVEVVEMVGVVDVVEVVGVVGMKKCSYEKVFA